MRHLLSAAVLGTAAIVTPVAQADVIIGSFEGGINGVSTYAPNTVAASSLHATNGTGSIELTLGDSWGWHWMKYDLPAQSISDMVANRYLLFDVYAAQGTKIAGLAGQSLGQSWHQQDMWTDPTPTPTYTAGQTIVVPTYAAGGSTGLGMLPTDTPLTIAWDYKAAGLNYQLSDTWAHVDIVFQGATGTQVYIDNLRVANAVPEPASMGLLAIAAGVGFTRRRRA